MHPLVEPSSRTSRDIWNFLLPLVVPASSPSSTSKIALPWIFRVSPAYLVFLAKHPRIPRWTHLRVQPATRRSRHQERRRQIPGGNIFEYKQGLEDLISRGYSKASLVGTSSRPSNAKRTWTPGITRHIPSVSHLRVQPAPRGLVHQGKHRVAWTRRSRHQGKLDSCLSKRIRLPGETRSTGVMLHSGSCNNRGCPAQRCFVNDCYPVPASIT